MEPRDRKKTSSTTTHVAATDDAGVAAARDTTTAATDATATGAAATGAGTATAATDAGTATAATDAGTATAATGAGTTVTVGTGAAATGAGATAATGTPATAGTTTGSTATDAARATAAAATAAARAAARARRPSQGTAVPPSPSIIGFLQPTIDDADLVKEIATADKIREVRGKMALLSDRLKLVKMDDALRASLGSVPPPEQLSLSMACERFVGKWQDLGVPAGTPHVLWQDVVAKDVGLGQFKRGVDKVVGSIGDATLVLAAAVTERDDRVEGYVDQQVADPSVDGAARDRLEFNFSTSSVLRERAAQRLTGRQTRGTLRQAQLASTLGSSRQTAEALVAAEKLAATTLPLATPDPGQTTRTKTLASAKAMASARARTGKKAGR